jgi:pimeloyl-ACP methyl ester carboxylesterase
MPGHSKSSKNEQTENCVELLADSVHAVLSFEKIKKAFFFGHSQGFTVTEIITRKYPELCAGIGCIDGVHFEVPENEQEKQEWLEFNRDLAEPEGRERQDRFYQCPVPSRYASGVVR